MIKFVSGDFFDFEADIRINTVNCVGAMGAGVALLFKNKFPLMYKEYYKLCKKGEIKPGQPHVWKSADIFSNGPTIINFPTKNHWRKPSEYEYIEKGLTWLRGFLKEKGKITITLPALGCGHGGLEWSKVKQLIGQYLEGLDTNILVFEPKSSTNSSLTKELKKELNDKGVISLQPSDPFYPVELKGKSAQELFVKGDSSIFKHKLISILIDSKASEQEKKATSAILKELSKHKDFIISLGLGSSLETDLLKEVLSYKVKVVIMLPYGILKIKKRKDLESVWDENLITMVSLAHPRNDWKRHEAVKSLKFRLQTADATIITTKNFETLSKQEKVFSGEKSIFYTNYGIPPVDFLNRINAKKIGRSKETKLPNLSPVIQAVC